MSNFGFAFNNINFSDHILRIEIVPDLPSNDTTHDGRVAESVEDNDPPLNQECSQVLRVETLHISSVVLAANSPFFYKMFTSGTRESVQRDVNLQIHASGEAPLMELLNYMYVGSVSASTHRALLDVMMTADKYDVASCVRYCSKLLLNLPMTCESALFYLDLDLSSNVSLVEAVQPLMDSAKHFHAAHYKDLTKFREEVLKLPLVAIEAVFSSDTLQVRSEDHVYDFLVEWAQLHYPEAEDRRKVFGSRLGPLVRFPYMTVQKLVNVMSSNDYFNPKFASDVVGKAIVLKSELPYSRTHSEERLPSQGRCVERAYRYLPIKVVHFESPRQQCIMYLEVKREECLQLSSAGRVCSQTFQLGGQDFYLIAHYSKPERTSPPWFCVYVAIFENGSINLSLDYEIAVRAKPTENYVIKCQGSYALTGNKDGAWVAVDNRNLFSMPWTEFMGEDSLYFINGSFHVRADLIRTGFALLSFFFSL